MKFKHLALLAVAFASSAAFAAGLRNAGYRPDRHSATRVAAPSASAKPAAASLSTSRS